MAFRNYFVGKTVGKWTFLAFVKRDEKDRYWWTCRCECGTVRDIRAGGHSFSCGCVGRRKIIEATRKRRGPLSVAWKGGKILTGSGYTKIMSPSHPNRDKCGYVNEHHLVMEATLGRYLVKGENVHHKNGARSDNRPSNLELWVTAQPSGQRPADLVAYACEILARYSPERLFPQVA